MQNREYSQGTEKTQRTGIFCLVFLIIASLLLSACSEGTVGTDTSANTEFSAPDTSAELPVVIEPVTESKNQEVRGVWIASVYNINYPSKPGLDKATLMAELDDIVKTTEETGLNAIYFQVRPSGDALYKSDIFPVSEYLSGEQGKDADGGFDPLAYLLETAHAKGIKVHAWVNPMRVTVGSAAYPKVDPNELHETNPARQNPTYAIPYADGRLYYDPGKPEVRELIASGVKEIVEKYKVDGIIFDDYFYPYQVYINIGGNNVLADFNDLETYSRYGNGMDYGDWRRENVNQMVKACYNAIKSVREDCLFGIAPFGIWQNDNGTNGGSATGGMESYSAIYCDTLAFVRGGYVDYIAPQIYWNFTTSVARYDTLVRWWNAQVAGSGVDLLISHGVYRYEDMDDPDREIARQVEFARSELCYKGSIHYGYASIKNNTKGLADELRSVYSRDVVYEAELGKGQPFVISTPQNGSWVDTSSTYLIGSADPQSKVTFNGMPVSLTKSGCFSVHTDLEMGENIIEFFCNGEKYTHSIYRYEYSPGGYTVMDSFKISSYYPSERVTVTSGNTVSLSCTAPTGCRVVALVGGKEVELNPILGNVGEEEYIAEIYRGSVEVDAVAEGLASLGNVVFVCSRGEERVTKIGAEVRVISEGCGIPIRTVKDYSLLKTEPDSSFYDDYTPQIVGMEGYAVGEKEGYWLLSMGGYLAVSDAESGECTELPPVNILGNVTQDTTGKETVFYIETDGKPALSADLAGESFVVTLFNCGGENRSVNVKAQSKIAIGAELVCNDNSENAELRITLAAEKNFYGFTFGYEEYNGKSCIKIALNNAPSVSEGDKPLVGKTIVLDAGHGGNDPGALGAFGAESNKNEADINLAIVLALKEKLEALGAKIVLTRDSDVSFELEDREIFLLNAAPDMAVIVHQNSMPYNSDITKIRGIAAFYNADSGKLLASCISNSLGKELHRGEYDPAWLTLMLCRNHRFVSALVETGFITSMEEYERMLSAEGIDSTAEGIKNGILEFYRRAAEY